MSVKFKPDHFGDDKVVRLEDSNRRVTVTFVCGKSKSLAGVTRVLGSQATLPNSIAPVDTQRPNRQIPSIQFRVLIIGRANAGKTSILQRVCETTDSPVIRRGQEEVTLDPSMDRGEHSIDDQLVFSNYKGYIFHDSRGIESGSTEELKILQEFIQRKCKETRLRDRLHAIWFGLSSVHITITDSHILRYCVPMDNQRPILDLKFFRDVCPDQNVPLIAVFTKYDQFLRNVAMHVADYPNEYLNNNVSEVAEQQFKEHYLYPLGKDIGFVRLEKMHRQNTRCNDLIEKTAAVLSRDIVTLMLLAVQRDNFELCVRTALNRVLPRTGVGVKDQDIVRECLIPFPYIWASDVSDCRGWLHF
ncbi:hypothetical protein EDB89DRAFT_2106657 [Lactarius sanguifluus]|nr:hypothetical protein EDB89DRAFT_2106657 [Lactarius sanguifluus]